MGGSRQLGVGLSARRATAARQLPEGKVEQHAERRERVHTAQRGEEEGESGDRPPPAPGCLSASHVLFFGSWKSARPVRPKAVESSCAAVMDAACNAAVALGPSLGAFIRLGGWRFFFWSGGLVVRLPW
ncbi:hypothetical protein VUR80DRAFT_586 [Thermomyces stellatus]